MWLIARKELKELLYSPKYLFVFISAFLIISFAFINGYINFVDEFDRIEALDKQLLDGLPETLGYNASSMFIYRKPDAISIIDTGVSYATGNADYITLNFGGGAFAWSGASSLTRSRYSSNPGLALFKELDVTQTVLFLFSLFALLLSHNSISGEREAGTLKLIHANSISRAAVLGGKIVGGFIPLLLTFLLPFLICLIALISITDIAFNASHWSSIIQLTALYILYILFFYSIGIISSVFTRTAFASFLVTLLIWVSFVIVIPRLAVETANMLTPVTPIAVQGDTVHAANGEIFKKYAKLYFEKVNEMKLTPEQFQQQAWEIRNSFTADRSTEMAAAKRRLQEQYDREAQANLTKLEKISRFSPVSLFKFTSIRMSGNDHRISERFAKAKAAFEPEFFEKAKIEHDNIKEQMADYWKNRPRTKTEKDAQGFVRAYIQGDPNVKQPVGDTSSLPKFKGIVNDPARNFENSIVDLAILLFLTLTMLGISIFKFIRYDVR